MPEHAAAERTEYPTPRRLSKARAKGQIPHSVELSSFALISALVAVIAFMAPKLLEWCAGQIVECLSCNREMFAGVRAFTSFINSKLTDAIIIICPILAALCAGSIAANIIIGGWNYAPQALKPKLNLLNPAANLGKFFNVNTAVTLLTSILKLLFVSLIVWFYLKDKLEVFAALRWAWSIQILSVTCKIILGVMIRVCLALLVIGAADAFYQKWKYIHDLKMTKQEVKEEHRDKEGAPEVKSRIRRIQVKMTLKRMMQEVPKASVVLVNPTHIAVALRYEAKIMDSPVVVAKGADYLAEKIIEIARAYGVPIIRRPELARTIYSTVEVGGPIPPTLYVAVAEILAMIYRLRQKKQK
jgi:flagellar biosynthetic protein FlhB